MKLFPVVLAVSDEGRSLKGRDRVVYLSRHARKALDISARKSGVLVDEFAKNSNGIPQPVDGNYWSVTHKPEYVGAVVAPERIGIDIEKIRSFSKGLFKKTADPSEWCLTDEDPDVLFFRYWTSKEAILKAVGTGVKDLLKCRIVNVMSEAKLVATYMDQEWMIHHLYFDNHIASVVENSFTIEWSLLRDQ